MTGKIVAQSAEAGGDGRMARSAPWLIAGLWMGGMLAAFWFFELRVQGSFRTAVLGLADSDVRVTRLESWFRTTMRPAGGGIPTVVHIYQTGCACNGDMEPRVAAIEQRYRSRGVRLLRVERDARVTADNFDGIDATPAALVFNGAGKLVYFGPYSDAAWCGASGDLVEKALDQSLLGTAQHLRKISARGCFCASRPAESRGSIS